MVKVDFKNAFNSLRWDKMLRAVKDHIPDLLPFVHSAYSSSSILLWNDVQVLSAKGHTAGGPPGPNTVLPGYSQPGIQPVIGIHSVLP